VVFTSILFRVLSKDSFAGSISINGNKRDRLWRIDHNIGCTICSQTQPTERNRVKKTYTITVEESYLFTSLVQFLKQLTEVYPMTAGTDNYQTYQLKEEG